MEKFLRGWRKEAVEKNLFDTAVFVGDKVLALTGSDHDAFWLAQTYFDSGNYIRALSLLSSNDLIARSPQCKYLAGYCYIKQGRFDEALSVLGEKNPVHLASTTASTRRKLQHHHGDSAPNGTHRPGKSNHKADRVDQDTERQRADASNTRFEAAMCYLRGICYAKQNAFDRAKECYKDAVKIDVQCFEAFDQLMKNALMSPDEEWVFLESLNFDSIKAGDTSASQQAAELTRMLYVTRLSKYKNSNEIMQATETLSTHYNLSTNPDILLSRAELLFTQCRFKEALNLTESVLENDPYSFGALPVHLACLNELHESNALFLLAHDLADHHPEEPATWLAVGVYYLTIGKVSEARRFFSKSSLMDPHFGPAWIGFAHTFAAEGEHDQAISAYSTAARLFQGTHLPQLFLGMQNLALHNLTLAREYLNTAYTLCTTDPLLLNELGVVLYRESHLTEAANAFTTALSTAAATDADPRAWTTTRANLGHAYRRMFRWRDALAEFDAVLRASAGRDVSVLCAKALVLLEMGTAWAATVCLHEALAVSPQDALATELLNRALEETSLGALWGDEEAEGEDAGGGGPLGDAKADAVIFASSRRTGAATAGAGAGAGWRAGNGGAAYPTARSAEAVLMRVDSPGRGAAAHMRDERLGGVLLEDVDDDENLMDQDADDEEGM